MCRRELTAHVCKWHLGVLCYSSIDVTPVMAGEFCNIGRNADRMDEPSDELRPQKETEFAHQENGSVKTRAIGNWLATRWSLRGSTRRTRGAKAHFFGHSTAEVIKTCLTDIPEHCLVVIAPVRRFHERILSLKFEYEWPAR